MDRLCSEILRPKPGENPQPAYRVSVIHNLARSRVIPDISKVLLLFNVLHPSTLKQPQDFFPSRNELSLNLR